MTKRETEAQRAFRKELARMISDFRHFVHAPHLLIGKATIILLDRGETVTKEAIKSLVAGLDEAQDAGLVERTLLLLDQPATDDL